MESYELDKETIVTWGSDYASFEDLELAAKALYSIYGARRRVEAPEAHLKAKRDKRALYSSKPVRTPYNSKKSKKKKQAKRKYLNS